MEQIKTRSNCTGKEGGGKRSNKEEKGGRKKRRRYTLLGEDWGAPPNSTGEPEGGRKEEMLGFVEGGGSKRRWSRGYTQDPRMKEIFPEPPLVAYKRPPNIKDKLTQDPRMKDIFPEPPLVAYKRPPNIKDKLVRAKVPKTNSGRPKRRLIGMKRCQKCVICPFVKEGKAVSSTSNNCRVDINTSVSCVRSNIIYLLGCNRCPQ